MGGGCTKQRRFKRRPPDSDSDEDSESGSGSSSRGSSRQSSSRKSSTRRSSKRTSSSRRRSSGRGSSRTARPGVPKTPTKQAPKLRFNDAVAVAPNAPSFPKQTAISKASQSSTPPSKFYIDAKDLNSRDGFLLVPKGKPPTESRPVVVPSPGNAQFEMAYMHKNGVEPFPGPGLGPALGVGHMVKWEKATQTPTGQQYAYYFDEKKDLVPGFAGGGFYQEGKMLKYSERAPTLGAPPTAPQKAYLPGIASPYNPFGCQQEGFYYYRKEAQESSRQYPPLLPLMPPPVPGIVVPPRWRPGTPEMPQQQAPPWSGSTTSKSEPPAGATARQVDELQLQVEKNHRQQRELLNQINQNFTKMEAKFTETMRHLKSGKTVSSRMGPSTSFDEPDISHLQNRYQSIALTVDGLSQDFSSRKAPTSSGKQSNTSDQPENGLSVEKVNAMIEQFARELEQLRSLHQIGK